MIATRFVVSATIALTLSATAAIAQEDLTGGGSGGPSIDVPVVGEVPIPGFIADLLGVSSGQGQSGGGQGSGGQSSGGQGGQGGGQNRPPAVVFKIAQTQPVGDRFRFLGRITPIERVNVQARVSGFIDEVAFEGGEYVQQGDLLFQIQQSQYEAALQSAEARLAGAEAQFREAERQLQRQRELEDSGTVSQASLDDAIARFESARADRLQARAAVTQAELDLSYTTITAPIDGQMSAPILTQGNYVTASTGTLAELVQLDPIWGVFSLGENRLATWRRIGVGAAEAAPINAQSGEGGGSGPTGGSGSGSGTTAGADGAGSGSGSSEATSGTGSGTTGGGLSETGTTASDPSPADSPSPDPRSSAGEAGEPGQPGQPGSTGQDTLPDTQAREERLPDSAYRLSLQLPNGATYGDEGEFAFLGNTVDAQTGTVEVRVRFPNPDGILLPNQNVALLVREADPPVLPVIPQPAIQLDREGRAVWIVREDDTVTRLPIEVEPGPSAGTVAVTRGLDGGERVVVRGALRLSEGQTVDPRMASSGAVGGTAQGGGSSGGGSGGASGSGSGGSGGSSGSSNGGSGQ